MKKFILTMLFILSIAISAQADRITSNASPAIVAVSSASPTKEITFPQIVSSVSVFNYDPDDGCWINWRGADTAGPTSDGSRFYLGPSSVITLNDFLTSAITIVWDDGMFSAGEASPISVIGTY